MNNFISYNLPIWNGLNKNFLKLKTARLNINNSKIKGIFMQVSKKMIKYDNNYEHMTPLFGSSYIEKLRDKKMKLIINRINKKDAVLEIGSGDSRIARNLRYKHLTIVDPSIKNPKNNYKNINIFREFYENLNLKKKYDHIVLFSVIEHVENIEKFFNKLNSNIKTNGFVYITTPVIDNQFLRGDFNSLLHEHTYYFTNYGLINLFNKYSLKVLNFKIENDCGYIILQKKKNAKNKNPYICYDINTYKNIFNYQLMKFKNFTKNNKNIVFFGATNGLNNLIFLSKLNTYNNNYSITDSDESKIGKYLPSSPKKIIDKKKIKKTNIICISAQSFKEEIMLQNFNLSSTYFNE